MSKGIIYEYEDGGHYCGEWEDDASHGYGICTGPYGQGKFEGLWEHGNQVSGVYTWPKGMKYMGTWQSSMRSGTGKEIQADGREYSGDFTRGARGPFGVTRLPNGVYRGSWYNGTQEGEGVEAYLDGGYYRGQYKKGVRHGYGTRSSSSYERGKESLVSSSIPKTFSEPKFNIPTLTAGTSNFSLEGAPSTTTKIPDAPKRSIVETKERTGSILSNSSRNGSKDPNAQIYSGEWKDDKRHGFGVLKVLGLYTYYGEWNQNTRTGYGVLSYETGRKEEGLWQNGKLIEVFKRKKITFKTSQLETKVKQAHTNAIQAADMARNKGLLAESRASSALAKARTAHKSAQQALNNAQLAVERADLYKNAPRISECVKTPMVDLPVTFPAVDGISSPPNAPHGSDSLSSLASSKGSDSPRMSLLGVNRKVVPSTSFEDIRSVLQASSIHHSDSDDSVEGSEDSIGSLHRRRDYFRRKTNSESSGSQASSEMSMDEALRAKRLRLVGLSSSEVGATFDTVPSVHVTSDIRSKRRVSDTAVDTPSRKTPLKYTRSNSLSEEDEHLVDSVDYPRRRVDKTTGEIDHGDVTDEELLDEKKSKRNHLPPPPRPLVKSNSVTVEMLTQMANWNKMVAYINFALLIFLLLLILIVVMTLQYYQLSNYYYNHAPEEENPAANFMRPMA